MGTRTRTRSDRKNAVVSLNAALDAIINALRRRAIDADDLEKVFGEWLGVLDSHTHIPVEGLWHPREVAAAGFLEASGRNAERSFQEGLAGLRRRTYFDPNQPQGFEADGLAMLGVASGIQALRDRDANTWLGDLCARALSQETDEWRHGLVEGARYLLGAETPSQPEVAVALASKTGGTCVSDGALAAAVSAATSITEVSPERAIVRLKVLEHAARRTASPAPGRTALNSLDKVKVLFLAANPTASSRLQLDEELRDIKSRIRAAQHRDAFDLVSEHAVQPDDLEQALLEHRPVTVHFSGHGSGANGIVFHGTATGSTALVNGDVLADLFRILKKQIRVVVLNACYSEHQAQAIVREIDFVVGMNDTIGDNAARHFAASFYRALAFGESVHTAFQLGKNAIRRAGLGDANVPELLVRAGANTDHGVL